MQKLMLFLLFAAATLASCSDNNYKKTKSGLIYKIYSDGKGPVAKKGSVLKFHRRQLVRDSLLHETYGGVPMYEQVDSVGAIYNYTELFTSLRKGDSLVVVFLGDSVLSKYRELPPFMKKEDKFTMTFKVIEVFEAEDAARADLTKLFDSYKPIQEQKFEQYMASRKGNLQKTPGGVYVDIKTPGDGPAADSGKMVSVLYRGKLLPSEKEFETNMKADGQPYDVIMGAGRVIPGWEEGLKLFRKGGKGTLYIPGALAYGPQPGPGGQPHQPLIFDIEVVDVKDAPMQPNQPFIPGR